MKKVVRYVDEDTLEIKESMAEEESIRDGDEITKMFQQALGCEPEEFSKKYTAYKKAEAEFNAIYEPFKENLLKIYETDTPKDVTFPKNLYIGNAKLTYISPSTRSTIDSKKFKEELPDIAKKYTKVSNVKASIRLEDFIGGLV